MSARDRSLGGGSRPARPTALEVPPTPPPRHTRSCCGGDWSQDSVEARFSASTAAAWATTPAATALSCTESAASAAAAEFTVLASGESSVAKRAGARRSDAAAAETTSVVGLVVVSASDSTGTLTGVDATLDTGEASRDDLTKEATRASRLAQAAGSMLRRGGGGGGGLDGAAFA